MLQVRTKRALRSRLHDAERVVVTERSERSEFRIITHRLGGNNVATATTTTTQEDEKMAMEMETGNGDGVDADAVGTSAEKVSKRNQSFPSRNTF